MPFRYLPLFLLTLLTRPALAQLEQLGEAGESEFNPLKSRPNYRRTAVGWEKNAPPDSAQRRYSVFLIGDVGSPIGTERGGEPSLNYLHRQLLRTQERSAVVYLGDNIYNEGMPPQGAYDRATAEKRLAAQLDVLRGYRGEKYMVPGNHDWIQGSKNGLAQVNRERDFAEQYLARDSAAFAYSGDFWLPREGCPGPYEVRLLGDLLLIALDSQWFLTDQANRPFGSVCGAANEAEAFAQLEDVIKRNADKHILVVAHHPLFSDGIHGGYFTLADHLFPLSIVAKYAFVPLPVIGSIYPLARKYGGISQDLAYPAYQNYKKNLLGIFAKYPNVVYANGHEHNLQYYDDAASRAHFITSGSGCKTQHVKPGRGGVSLFSDKEKGLARLDYYQDGQVWVEYLVARDADQGRTARTVYRQRMYAGLGRGGATATEADAVSKPTAAALARRPDFKDSTITRAINPAYAEHGRFHNWLLGEHYRAEWATPVRFPVLDVLTAEGGISPYKTGGGKQTASLKLRNDNGTYYSLRGIDKDPAAVLPDNLRTGLARAVLQDQISAQHPYAAFVLPPLAQAAGILHTSPRYVFIPDDPALGTYRRQFANVPAALDEDAKGSQEDNAALGFAKKLVSTDKMLEKLLDDNDNRVDEPAFARSRLFDMWIGDWDRHEDQWRWAERKTKDGDRVYTAVPEDRDIAFFKGDGVLPGLISRKFAVRNFQNFGYDFGDYKGLNLTGLPNDRLFLSGVSRQEWVRQARVLQEKLTDAVIEKAFRERWPKEIYALHGPEIIAKLKTRRALLPDVAAKYADVLAARVEVRGSRKREKFEVERLPGYRTRVVVRKISKQGKLTKTLFERTFDEATDEIRLYGIAGDDVYELRGDQRQGHKIRLIAGTGRDSITDDSRISGPRHRTQIYDADTGNVIRNRSGEARLRLEPGAEVSRYDHPRRFNLQDYRLNKTAPTLFAGYNIDDGLLLGGGLTHRRYGFRREPYSSEQSLVANFAVNRQNAYNLRYSGHFVSVFGGTTSLRVAAQFYGPQLLYNFFGLGNDTQNNTLGGQDESSLRSVNARYRVRFDRAYLAPTLERPLLSFGKVGFGPQIERFRIERDQIGTVIRDSIGAGFDNRRFGVRASDFQPSLYVGALAYFDLGAQDTERDPRIGLRWHNEAQYNVQLNGERLRYGRLASEVKFYLTPNFPFRLTYAGRLGWAHNLGDYRFYQANTLGGTSNLRGYRRTRFAGRTSAYANFEARLHLFKFNAYLFPGEVGLLGLADAGRVYTPNDLRTGLSAFHTGFGGGVFVKLLQSAVVNATYTVGEEQLALVGFDFLF